MEISKIIIVCSVTGILFIYIMIEEKEDKITLISFKSSVYYS